MQGALLQRGCNTIRSEYKNLILNDKLAFGMYISILKALEGELLIRKDFYSFRNYIYIVGTLRFRHSI